MDVREYRYQLIESVMGDWTLLGTYDYKADALWHQEQFRSEYRRNKGKGAAAFEYIVRAVPAND